MLTICSEIEIAILSLLATRSRRPRARNGGCIGENAVEAPRPVDALDVPIPDENTRMNTPDDYEGLRVGFTAAVSHELRTPLARLLSLLDTAALPGVDKDEIISDVRDEVIEMNDLITDILFLSELEQGREIVALGSTAIAPVVDEAFGSLRDRAHAAEVTLARELTEASMAPLRPRMLRVVVENLADNAIRYAGRQTTFTLRAWAEGDELVVEGSDDGIGVRQHDADRLFERFFRGDRARTSRGTGLGLAIVKHVISAAGGSVEAVSEPGQGLAVRCRMPL